MSNNKPSHLEAFALAQTSIANLKAAVYAVLAVAPDAGLSNAQIGRSLGIYTGHEGHEGHISRTVLAMLQQDGVADQNPDTKAWRLVR